MRGRKVAGSAGFAASAAAMYIPSPDVASEGRINNIYPRWREPSVGPTLLDISY